jgi:hypothetical protein
VLAFWQGPTRTGLSAWKGLDYQRGRARSGLSVGRVPFELDRPMRRGQAWIVGTVWSVTQVAPLTDAVRALLLEIKAEQEKGRVANLAGLIFVDETGKPISARCIEYQVVRARHATGIKGWSFHSCRHTAKTVWAQAGIPPEAAMRGAGHSSASQHLDYIHLQRGGIGKLFGTRKNVVLGLYNEKKGRSKK